MKEIIKALAKARGEFDDVQKDKVNPHFRNRYASLDAINKAVSKALTANGLAITQLVQQSEKGQVLKTVLWHTSGECIESTMALPVINDMQKMGSALTYARRYSMSALLCLSADEDDDGNGQAEQPKRSSQSAQRQQPPRQVNQASGNGNGVISQPQQKRLFTISSKHGWSNDAVKAMVEKMGWDSTSKIPKSRYEEVCKNLENEELRKQWTDHLASQQTTEESGNDGSATAA